MSETVSVKLAGFRKFLRIAAVLTMAFALVCFATPVLSKRMRLTALGERTISEMAAFSMSLSHFASSDLEKIARQPKVDIFSKELSALLAKVSERNGYEGMVTLARTGNKGYAVLADSKYREGGVAGTDYYAAGAAYPLEVYKYSAGRLDSIYSGKSAATYIPNLVVGRNAKPVTSVYLPIYGQGSAVLAVVAVDVAPENTSYNMLGPIDLNYAGVFFLVLFALCMLTLAALKKYLSRRQQPLELVAEELPQEPPQPVQDAMLQPESGESDDV